MFDNISKKVAIQSFSSSIDSIAEKCLFPRAIEPPSRFQQIRVTNKIQILRFTRVVLVGGFVLKKSLSGHACSITIRGLYPLFSMYVPRMFRLNNRESFNRCSREERIERTQGGGCTHTHTHTYTHRRGDKRDRDESNGEGWSRIKRRRPRNA